MIFNLREIISLFLLNNLILLVGASRTSPRQATGYSPRYGASPRQLQVRNLKEGPNLPDEEGMNKKQIRAVKKVQYAFRQVLLESLDAKDDYLVELLEAADQKTTVEAQAQTYSEVVTTATTRRLIVLRLFITEIYRGNMLSLSQEEITERFKKELTSNTLNQIDKEDLEDKQKREKEKQEEKHQREREKQKDQEDIRRSRENQKKRKAEERSREKESKKRRRSTDGGWKTYY